MCAVFEMERESELTTELGSVKVLIANATRSVPLGLFSILWSSLVPGSMPKIWLAQNTNLEQGSRSQINATHHHPSQNARTNTLGKRKRGLEKSQHQPTVRWLSDVSTN